jgi:ZIP family zinc transporter
MVSVISAALLGLISGLVPVYLGLLPIPLLKRLSPYTRSLLVSFSLGILVFLFADVTGQAVESAKKTWQGSLFLVSGLVLGLLLPSIISLKRNTGGNVSSPKAEPRRSVGLFSAYLISFGIGLHNLGEGLALGAAYGGGQISLTTLLVVGFTLHNGTEGLAISGPILDDRVGLKEPLIMGFIAGFPSVIGSVLGSIAYTDLFGVLFFSLASGALLYVIFELARLSHPSKALYSGMILGILVMYFTDLLLSV